MWALFTESFKNPKAILYICIFLSKFSGGMTGKGLGKPKHQIYEVEHSRTYDGTRVHGQAAGNQVFQQIAFYVMNLILYFILLDFI